MLKGNMKTKKEIAPRLFNGDPRVSIGHGLPDYVKEGLKRIAEREHKSVSWVLEQVIIEYFGLKIPKYRTKKNDRE